MDAGYGDINTRDLVGYGGQYPRFSWPNGAKIALSFVVNYEEGGENTVLNGDPASEVFLNETPGGRPRPGRDMNMETQYEYGTRAGVHRLLRLFRRYGFKFTCFAVGRAVELCPDPVTQMHEEGHEVCSHNYRWIDYDAEGVPEAEHCVKAIEAITKATGVPPRGWYTGRIGPQSREVVIRMFKKLGLDLLYDSDAYNDDLPYWVTVDGHEHLVIPYTLDQNDMKYCVPPGFSSPDGFFTYLKDAFDVLYEEGEAGTPKMMSIGLHCRLVGKPGRAAALQRFMEYVKSKDVWVATREEIAQFWRKEFPVKK
ncbi:putative polysaccharide deacetylase family protein [Gaertneriomyces semiglobifer]|nr:putative polysaccharide deacetylase family protein [Gaertneriomyces semiglobifer]